MRRVLVSGSRKWTSRTSVWVVLNQEFIQFGEFVLVHGACPTGLDDIADRWAYGMRAQGLNIQIEAHPADWETHGKRGGIIRNQEMVNLGADILHAWPLDGGTGTRHCMSRAFAAGIPVANHGYEPFTEQARQFAIAYG